MVIGFVGCEYDDSDLWNEVNSLKDRVLTLEQLCQQMNTNISSLQSLVSALQNQDYITSVTPIKQGNDVIGYTITFAKGEPITIYHGQDGKNGADGEDGKDGYTPVIGVDKDEDGVYYWTLDGEWLTDADGNKIPTSGKDGADGEDGEGGNGSMPELKIQGGYWYVSYDGGENWERLGRATGYDGTDGKDGVDGDSWFKSVEDKGDYVEFILKDGTVIVMPKYGNELELKAAIGGTVVLEKNVVLDEPLVVTGDLEINLNGYSIVTASGNAIQNQGSLKVKGDGKITSATTYGINNSGTLIVDGGEINAIFNSGSLTINNGTIKNTISGKHGIYHSGSKLIINNGEFSTTSGNELILDVSSAKDVEIKGGTFTQKGKAYLFGQVNAGMNITGGTFNGYVNNNGSNDGMRSGVAVVSGGVYNFDPSSYLALGYTAAESGDLWYVIKQSAGASAHDQNSLNSALSGASTTENTTIILDDGTYTITDAIKGKTVTIVGNEDTIVNVNSNVSQNAMNSTIHFEGVTIKGANTSKFGFPHTKEVTFKNCKINDELTLYSKTTFEGCTFESTAEHCIWTYGSPETSFTDCDFTYSDRCVNIYTEAGLATGTFSFDDCTFTTTNSASKGAVEINSSSYSTSVNVSLTGCTKPAHGEMVFISGWDSANGDKATVTIDGTPTSVPQLSK